MYWVGTAQKGKKRKEERKEMRKVVVAPGGFEPAIFKLRLDYLSN